jgi:hypothetical protein
LLNLILYPEDGGSTYLRNVSELLPDDTASHLRETVITTVASVRASNQRKRISIKLLRWAGGSVVGLGTMLQARMSWVRFPMRSLDFSIDLNLSGRAMVLGSTQPLTEMSTRNLV